MKKTLTLIVLAITLVGCENMLKTDIKGTYVLIKDPKRFRAASPKLEFTSTKVIMNSLFGEMAYSYKVEDGYVFVLVEGQGAGWRYKQMGPDTLIGAPNTWLEGVYVKQH